MTSAKCERSSPVKDYFFCIVQNAPEAVVALERKKQADAEEKIQTLRESIEALKK